MKHSKIYFQLTTFLVLLALLTAGCSSIGDLIQNDPEPTPLPPVSMEGRIIAEARAVPEKFGALSFLQPGRIDTIDVEEGDIVESGAILASQAEVEYYLADLKAAELELESAQQALDDLNQDSSLAAADAAVQVAKAEAELIEAQWTFDSTHIKEFTDQLDDREEHLQDMKIDLDDAAETLDRYLDLAEDNSTRMSAQNSYDAAAEDYQQALYERDQMANQSRAAEESLRLAEEALVKAQRELTKIGSGPDPDAAAVAEKRLSAAQSSVEAAQKRVADLELRAPFEGQVIKIHSLAQGVIVSSGQPVVTLIDPTNWYVETTDLSELDILKIEDGDEVEVTFDAIPGVDFTGEVESVGSMYSERAGDTLYVVRVHLENPPDGIRWGMSASVIFTD